MDDFTFMLEMLDWRKATYTNIEIGEKNAILLYGVMFVFSETGGLHEVIAEKDWKE